MKANGSKWVHVTFTTGRETFPPSPAVHANNIQIPEEDVKNLAAI
jgi:hypothetical protein